MKGKCYPPRYNCSLRNKEPARATSTRSKGLKTDTNSGPRIRTTDMTHVHTSPAPRTPCIHTINHDFKSQQIIYACFRFAMDYYRLHMRCVPCKRRWASEDSSLASIDPNLSLCKGHKLQLERIPLLISKKCLIDGMDILYSSYSVNFHIFKTWC